ncbi:ribonuclease Z [Lacticaseibacillus pabuli]|uniref:Ribonuclease Z n=1 Tax=Lacticaseibacillus pabuli TaxID=3025672 RepID=A0ABY7WN46_9LACO|nr:ribonuclease Z [Lacticaseibacillus sp. KACC 23028]WDF81614.1 ribonuclease Z [Lacticaseibacillus sp. KACC 23028]
MEIMFLGTGAGSPARNRNVSSLALKLLDERNEVWLFDCGEGTQHQILRTSIRPRKVNKIFLTHLHGDHIFGLPGFLASRANQGGQEPLTIYGPRGIKEYVQTSLRVTQTHLAYKLIFVELKPGKVFEDKTFRVYCDHLDHRIEAFGFRIEEKDHEGELLNEKAQAAGVPFGPLLGQLKARKMVTLPDGRVLDGNDFVGPDQKGRTLAIFGDTRQTPREVALAEGADVLVHESTFGADESKLARQYYHSTSVQAAKLAKKAGVKKLLLNHISARYVGKMALDLQKQARHIFPNSYVVNDLQDIDIPFVKENSDD